MSNFRELKYCLNSQFETVEVFLGMLSPTYWMLYDVIKVVQIYNSKLSTHMILTIMMMEATHVPIYIQIEALLGIWTPVTPLLYNWAKKN